MKDWYNCIYKNCFNYSYTRILVEQVIASGGCISLFCDYNEILEACNFIEKIKFVKLLVWETQMALPLAWLSLVPYGR